jgi:hypothetical protein
MTADPLGPKEVLLRYHLCNGHCVYIDLSGAFWGRVYNNLMKDRRLIMRMQVKKQNKRMRTDISASQT